MCCPFARWRCWPALSRGKPQAQSDLEGSVKERDVKARPAIASLGEGKEEKENFWAASLL